MLRRNLNVRKGLVNGASGTVVKFKWRIGTNRPLIPGDLPHAVLIKFDLSNYEEWIECVTVDYYATNHCRVKDTCYLWSSLFTKGQAYVALSHVKTFAGLAISELDISKLISTDKFYPTCSEALDEIERCVV